MYVAHRFCFFAENHNVLSTFMVNNIVCEIICDEKIIVYNSNYLFRVNVSVWNWRKPQQSCSCSQKRWWGSKKKRTFCCIRCCQRRWQMSCEMVEELRQVWRYSLLFFCCTWQHFYLHTLLFVTGLSNTVS